MALKFRALSVRLTYSDKFTRSHMTLLKLRNY